MENECWLPPLVYYDSRESWKEYEDRIYSIFRADFLDTIPCFENQPVQIRHYPIEYGKEDAFYHITTCCDHQCGQDRVPDLRRCERIKWVRSFIENYQCNTSQCSPCKGIKLWREPYKSTFRVHLLFEEERYTVVLEPRRDYCLLITAFYLDYDHSLRKQLNQYNRYKT